MLLRRPETHLEGLKQACVSERGRPGGPSAAPMVLGEAGWRPGSRDAESLQASVSPPAA